MSRDDDLAAALDPLADSGAAAGPALGQVRELLAAEHAWDEPPPGLRDRLLAQALEESAGLGQVTPGEAGPGRTGLPQTGPEQTGPPQPGPGPGQSETATASVVDELAARRSRRRVPTWLAAVAGAAAAAVAVAALGPVVTDLRPSGGDSRVVALAGTERAPDADVTALVEEQSAGFAITLEITGLPPAPAGSYYAGWLRGPAGDVPIGTFHWREGGVPIELWSGVSPEEYPELVVGLQDEGSPASYSAERAFLTGTLDRTEGRSDRGEGA